MKYGALTLGQVEALVNKLGGMSEVEKILGGACAPSSDMPIMASPGGPFSLTLDVSYPDGFDIVTQLMACEYIPCSAAARNLLSSVAFTAEKAKGCPVVLLDPMAQCSFDSARELAKRDKYLPVNPGIVLPLCEAIRRGLLDGLGISWIIIPHNPIKDEAGIDRVLAVQILGPKRCQIAAVFASKFAGSFRPRTLFAFTEPLKA